MKKPHLVWSVLFILLQSVVYGFGNPLTKVAYETITPFWGLFFRFTLASVIFMLFFGKSILNQLKSAKLKDYLPVSLCMAFAYIFCNIALFMTSATNVGFLTSLPVIFAPVLAIFILKDTYQLRHLPVQAAVLIGLLLLCMQNGSFSFNAGDFFALLSALFAAGSLVYGKRSLGTHLDAVTISATQTLCTAVISLIAALLFDDISVLPQIAPEAWGVVVYLAVFCTCIAYVLQNMALSWSSPALVSMAQCSQPVITAAVSFILLGENLTVLGLFGAVIIILCTIIESYLAR